MVKKGLLNEKRKPAAATSWFRLMQIAAEVTAHPGHATSTVKSSTNG